MLKNRLREIRMTIYQEEPQEFAKRINVALKAYYQYEKGNSRPTLTKAFEIAKALNMSVVEIWYLD